MKKILFITGDQSLTGGTERACANVANMLTEKGFFVEILSLNNGLTSYFELDSKVKLSSLALEGSTGVKLLPKVSLAICHYIKKYDFDYVVTVESLLFIFMIPSVFIHGKKIKIINWEHFNYDVDLGFKARRIARWFASRFADINIVLTQADRRKWINKLNTKANKVVQIYNLNPFDNLISKPLDLNSELNSHKTVLAAGRLTEQKGFDLLVEAWSKVDLNSRVGWQLKIVGEGDDRKKLESMISDLKLEDSISLPGSSADMVKAYRDSEVFVLSSRYEGFGLVLAEALSCGTPVISFDCPDGPSEIVYPYENGLLTNNGDVNALAKSLEVYMTDSTLRKHLRENTFIGLHRFSNKEVLPKWLELFEENK